MNRGNGGIFGKKNSTSLVGGMYSSYEQQEKSASVYWPSGPDSNFAYTPLLLKTTSQTSPKTTVTDSSANNLTVTKFGTQSVGWTSPYQASGYWSNYFGVANADYLSPASSASLAFGNNAYTVEFWIFMSSYTTGSNRVVDLGTSNNSFGVQINNTGTVSVTKYGAVDVFTSTASFVVNQWNHVAVVRTSTATNGLAIYLNGTNIGTGTDTNNWTVVTTPRINGLSGFSFGWTGYLSNFRIVNGTAVYTSNFTSPNAPLTSISGTALLTCQDNRFKDNSTNNLTLTPSGTPRTFSDWYPTTFSGLTPSIGALYNGSKTDTLTIPNTSAITTLAGDFTIESWVYPTDTTMTGAWGLIETRTSGQTAAPWAWSLGYSSPSFTSGFFTGTSYAFTLRVLPYVWSHIVLQRNGSTLRYFVNGVVDTTSFSLSGTISGGSSTIYISNTKDNNLGGYGTGGYYSDFRIVNGTGVYNVTGFTPPTSKLTAVANTVLLLSLSDDNNTSITDGANNNVFIDSSPYALTLTRNGTPTQGSFTPYWPNGYWSVYFGGSGNYMVTNTAPLATTTTTFTIECWIYPTATPVGAQPAVIGDLLATSGSNFLSFGPLSSNLLQLYWYDGAGKSCTGNTTISLNAWTHIAVSVNANVITLYVNGVSQTLSGTTTLTNRSSSYNYFTLGQSSPSIYYTGYISNLSVLNGTAKYSTSFTPTTSPLSVSTTNQTLLTCYSNRFIDSNTATTAKTITITGIPTVQAFQPLPSKVYSPSLYGGSGYFNGSTDSVYTNQTFSLATATTPFTMEAWVNFSSFSGVAIASTAYAGSGAIPFMMGMASSSAFSSPAATPIFAYYNGSAWTVAVQSSTSLSLNTWYHLAYVYTGSTATVYANGVSIGSASISSWQTTGQSGFYVGRRWDTNNSVYFNGYISNFRLVIGTAVYTGTFTPPTLAPLTFDGQTSAASYANTANVNTSFGKSQTVLLTNFNNTAIYDATSQNDLVAFNTPQTSIVPTKFPLTTVMKFNGTSDYLTAPVIPSYSFGTGDFTVEGWFYWNAFSADHWMVALGTGVNAGGPFAGWGLRYSPFDYGNAVLNFTRYDGTEYTYQFSLPSANYLVTGTWYHIACTRSGTNIRMFLNGSQIGAAQTSSVAFNAVNTDPLIIGKFITGRSGSPFYFNGYMQDIRFTKGVARYITNFAVPVLPFGTSGRPLF